MNSDVVSMRYPASLLTAFAYAAPIGAFKELAMSQELVSLSGGLPATLSIV
ncbi:MAG: hypothetical protein ABJH07_25515 [Sedimentitalea sp.]|uniref:hypothetical protein n=1 Tax=Sedimentitalea sp. TaxID=2048915 RepID=UPI00326635AB